jgi:hypothetical protein
MFIQNHSYNVIQSKCKIKCIDYKKRDDLTLT